MPARSISALAIACVACHVTPQTGPVQAAPTAAPSSTPAPPAPSPPEPPPLAWRHQFVTAPEAGTFAVVDGRTTLHKYPRQDDRGAPFSGIHPGVVKVVGHEQGFVVVDFDWPDDPAVQHCVQDPAIPIGLRVYVREDELADVTTASITIATGQDTGIVAAPGVLVSTRRDTRELYARNGTQSYLGSFSTNRLHVETSAPVPRVGKYYAPIRVDSLRAELLSFDAFRASHEPHTPSRIDIGETYQPELTHSWRIYAMADKHHIVAGAPCLHVAGHVSVGDSGGAGGGGCSIGVDRWHVAAGTALTWRTGGPAGVLHRELELFEPPRRRGDRRCFAPPFACSGPAELTVCAPARSVTHVPGEPPRSLRLATPRLSEPRR